MGCRIEDIGGYRCVFETGMTLSTFRMQHSKETVAFLDVEVNHIAKNAGHINKIGASKNAPKVGIFVETGAFFLRFFRLITEIGDSRGQKIPSNGDFTGG